MHFRSADHQGVELSFQLVILTNYHYPTQVVGRNGQRLTLGPNNHVVIYAGTEVRTPLGKLFNNLDSLLNEERQL